MFKLIKKHLKYDLKNILFYIITDTTYQMTLTLSPLILGKFLDEAFTQSLNLSILKSFILVFVICYLTEIITFYFSNVLVLKIQSRVTYSLNYYVIEHLKKLPINIFSSIDPVYLSQRTYTDCREITSFIITTFYRLISNILFIIILLTTILKLNFNFIYIFILSVIIYVFIYIVMKKIIYKKSYIFKELQNKFSSSLNDSFKNIISIRIHSLHKIFSSKLSDSYSHYYDSLVAFSKTSSLYTTFSVILKRVLIIYMIIWGGNKLIDNELSVGELTILLNYFTGILNYISKCLEFGKSYEQVKVSYNRILDILTKSPECNSNAKLDNISNITLNDVSFNHSSKDIFNNLNYKFEKGNVYCVIGENGKGKSTLLKLLLGLYDNFKGDILYNNTNIKELDLYDLRLNNISFIEQNCPYINDQIFLPNDNLKYLLEKYSKEFNLNHLIKKTNNGYIIKTDGYETLSGGEKQKIEIVRALLKNTDILIMDEPSSSIDKDALKLLCKVINQFKNNKIIIIVTHDSRIIELSDYVLDLNKNLAINN